MNKYLIVKAVFVVALIAITISWFITDFKIATGVLLLMWANNIANNKIKE